MDTTPVADADIDALAARLRAEIDASEHAADTDTPTWVASRREAGRVAQVTGDRELFRRPGAWGRARGAAIVPPKLAVRKLTRWYVEPIAADQRSFNGAVLRLADDITAWTAAGLHAVRAGLDAVSERVGRLEQALAAREADLRRLEDRLLRVERRPAAAGPAAAAAPAPQVAAAPFDYFSFEGLMREDRDEIRRRQAEYLEDFRDAAPVLDIGCGRGEFLTLLREAGVEARGIDADADMATFCRGEGLDVEHADALAYLEAVGEGSLGGIFCAHVVEHLTPPVLVRFLELAARTLSPGGVLVLETPNPVSLAALKHYFADLTHAQPLVPQTLAFLVRQTGLTVEEIRYRNEPEEAERLRHVPLPAGESFAAAQAAVDANVRRLNEVVFGPQDYAVVARR